MFRASIAVSFRRHALSAFVACVAVTLLPASEPAAALVDDFSQDTITSTGAPRVLVDDRELGSRSHATQKCVDGRLVVEGELVPGRGVPAFVSIPLLLAADAQPRDLSQYEGVRLRVRVNQGILAVQVASADVTNFDYHTSPPLVAKDEGQEMRLPFAAMKRAWSEQTPLDRQAVTSVNLVAFGTARAAFSYVVDEVGFY